MNNVLFSYVCASKQSSQNVLDTSGATQLFICR
jgi:hypothetical protein